ncbi:MAG: FGGY-family carbohydrate kinase [Chloroflexota bacterium]
MTAQYLLGIDIGTSLIKTVIFDLNGAEVGQGVQKVRVDSPQPGWFQQDMEAVWQGAAASIKAAIARAGIDPAQIAVVGPTGQGDGAWMIDAAGQPVGPAPLWNDGRAGDIISRWEQAGLLSELFKQGGTILWPGAQAAILAWLRQNEPDTFDRIDTVFCCKDWIKYKLTGQICTDETDGSIPFMSMASRRYDDGQLMLLHMGDVKTKLPPVKMAHEVMGYVTAAAAVETGLAAGTPVVAGLLDVAANAVGIGAIDAGQSFTLLGTTALNAIILDRPALDPVDVGATVCHGLPERWMRVLGAMAGTPNLDWYLANMGEIFQVEADSQGVDVYTLLEKTVGETPVGAGGVIFHPYLQGERAPFLNPAARAGFFGVSAATTRDHLARAVYEGVALSIRDCFESIGSQVQQVMLAGGGSNSPAWCQILADATGCPMVVPAGTQFGTLGAALVGAVGVGVFANLETAVARCIKIERTVTPNPANRQKYDALYALYRSLIPPMTAFWTARQKLLDEWRTNDPNNASRCLL